MDCCSVSVCAFAREASTAAATAKRVRFMGSLVSETHTWVLLRRAIRGHDAERETDRERNAERDEHGDERDDRLDSRELLDPEAQAAADDDARHSARYADEHRFAEKLKQDVLLRRAH